MPRIRTRRGTTSQWNSSTTPLLSGELGLDTTLNKLKAGNGTSLWADLPFLTSEGGGSTGDITFDGIQIIGAGTASGDGYGLGTIELVPDGDITSDQYLIIDPTALRLIQNQMAPKTHMEILMRQATHSLFMHLLQTLLLVTLCDCTQVELLM